MILPNLVSFHRTLLFILFFGYALSGIGQNRAIQLDGTTTLLSDISGTGINVQNFTMEVWLRTTSAGDQKIINSGGHHPLAVISGNARVCMQSGCETGPSINDGNWHHFAISYNTTTNQWFGVVDGTTTFEDLVGPTGNFGSTIEMSFGLPFNGDLDEIRIWNVNKTLAEIQASKDLEMEGNEPNLVALYDFDTPGSELQNKVTNGFATVSAGTPTYVTSGPTLGPANYALSFDGINDRVLIPDNPALEPSEGKLTIEAWIYPTTDSPHQRIVTKGDGSSAGIDDGSFYWDTYDNTAGARGLRAAFANSNDVYVSTPLTGEILTLNQWHHVALVFDQGIFTNYLNGVAVSSADLGETTLVDNNVDWAIGEDALTSNEHFNGQMDEVRIWHSVRTPSQLLAFKDVELTGDEPGLVAYYSMEVNTTLTDLA
ncbi:MAG: LamG-like jellyroll fold domain-containing protein, partial [Cyclobacteriaceae bacterium]